MSMLQVDNINVYYGAIHAVKDISFYVDVGVVVTLIGANGAGGRSSVPWPPAPSCCCGTSPPPA